MVCILWCSVLACVCLLINTKIILILTASLSLSIPQVNEISWSEFDPDVGEDEDLLCDFTTDVSH